MRRLRPRPLVLVAALSLAGLAGCHHGDPFHGFPIFPESARGSGETVHTVFKRPDGYAKAFSLVEKKAPTLGFVLVEEHEDQKASRREMHFGKVMGDTIVLVDVKFHWDTKSGPATVDYTARSHPKPLLEDGFPLCWDGPREGEYATRREGTVKVITAFCLARHTSPSFEPDRKPLLFGWHVVGSKPAKTVYEKGGTYVDTSFRMDPKTKRWWTIFRFDGKTKPW